MGRKPNENFTCAPNQRWFDTKCSCWARTFLSFVIFAVSRTNNSTIDRMWNVINHALSARRRVRRDLALLKRSLNWARRGRLSIRIYLLCQIIFRNCDKFSDYFLFDFLACIQFVGLTVLYSDKQKCISLKKKKGSANRTIFHFFSHWLTLFYFDISYSHFIAIIAFFFASHNIISFLRRYSNYLCLARTNDQTKLKGQQRCGAQISGENIETLKHCRYIGRSLVIRWSRLSDISLQLAWFTYWNFSFFLHRTHHVIRDSHFTFFSSSIASNFLTISDFPTALIPCSSEWYVREDPKSESNVCPRDLSFKIVLVIITWNRDSFSHESSCEL